GSTRSRDNESSPSAFMTFLSPFENRFEARRERGGSVPHGTSEPATRYRERPVESRGGVIVGPRSRDDENRSRAGRAAKMGSERGLRGRVLAGARETALAPRAARDRRLRGGPGRGQQKTR